MSDGLTWVCGMSNPSDIPHIIQKCYHRAEKLLLSHGITTYTLILMCMWRKKHLLQATPWCDFNIEKVQVEVLACYLWNPEQHQFIYPELFTCNSRSQQTNTRKKAAENSTSKYQTPRNQTVLGSINHPYPARLSWKLWTSGAFPFFFFFLLAIPGAWYQWWLNKITCNKRSYKKLFSPLRIPNGDCSQFLSRTLFCSFGNFFHPPPPLILKREQKNTKKISYASLVPRAVWNLLSVSKNSSLLATTSSCLANARG